MKSFEQLAKEVCEAESRMTDEQRLQFWSVIQMSYCPLCGKDLNETTGFKCYCDSSYDE